MSKKLNRENYIAVADWMLKYNLSTLDLMTYAIIFGFNNDPDGKNVYYASLDTLSKWLGIRYSNHALDHLKSLEDKGLIIKEKCKPINNQIICKYYTVCDKTLLPQNDPDCDYISIQSFMINELGLKNKELLTYAIIHSYSRKDSGNYCLYNKEYFAKWLQCRKDNVAAYIKKLKDKQLIQEVCKNDEIGFIAIVPKKRSTSLKTSNPKKRSTFPEKRSTLCLNNVDNNLWLDNLNNNLFINNNESINSNKQNKDYKEIYKSNNTAIIDKHGNSVVEKKKTSKGFDVSRFVNSHYVAIQKARIDEATYNDKYSSEIIEYVSDSCNCFGLKQINIINQFTDDEYGLVFNEASCLVDDEHPYYTSINNKKAYLSSVISKCIANHTNS